jgi:uncharacterized protein
MSALASESIAGTWIGGCAIQQGWVFLEAHFTLEAASLAGTMDMWFESEMELEIAELRLEPSRVHFALSRATGMLIFDGQRTDGAMSGIVTSADEQGTFHLVAVADVDPMVYDAYVGSYQLEADRVISIANFRGEVWCQFPVYLDLASGRIGALFPTSATTFVAGPAFLIPYPPEVQITFVKNDQSAVTGLLWREKGGSDRWAPKTMLKHEDVQFQNGEATLAGTLTTPVRIGPHPAIVLIHGSGEQRRDHAFLQFISDVFAVHEIAVLAYDKRGVGASSGGQEAMLDDLAGDALAGLTFLQTRNDICPQQIGLWGISQGGWIAPLAAARSQNVAFIILVSGPAVSVVQQDLDRVEYDLRAGGFSEGEVHAAVAHEQLFSEVAYTGQGWDKLEASIQHARTTKWASFVALPSKDEFERYGSLWGRFRAYDPVPDLKKVTCPVLAIFGGRDTVVPPEKNAPLMEQALKEGGNKDYTIKVFPDGEHVMIATTTGARQEIPRWTRFVLGYFDTMIEWLLKRVDVVK